MRPAAGARRPRPWSAAVIAASLVWLPARPGWAGWPTPAAGPSASGDPEIIFTFDDGPHERYTEQILDTLGQYEIKAIFFWVGHRVVNEKPRVGRRRAMVRRAVLEGHVIANHTIHHVHLCQSMPQQAAIEIDENARIFERLSGLPVLLFRAPYGSNCRRLRALLRRRHLHHLHWDIDAKEWIDHDWRRTADTLIGRLRHLKGRAVVLLHDNHSVTTRALPHVLQWIRDENQRRRTNHRRPIRILSGSELIAERFAPDLVSWIDDAARRATGRLSSVSRLVP